MKFEDMYLPKITSEIQDALGHTDLIGEGQWNQEAVDFVCILRDHYIERRKERIRSYTFWEKIKIILGD